MTKHQEILLRAGKKLLSWYQKEKRDLPWRQTKDPYPIWISETMLQQTRVETVKPYYQRFLETFPTPEDLAKAPEEEVVTVWQGLGYYSRARNLQSGVREWVEEYGGILPNERKTLESLRGIGPYTAGALLSIVYGLPEAAIDGNVFRVITRLQEISEEIDKPKTRKIVEEIVLEMMTAEDPGNFNQALMELGATICSPRSPRCSDCPIQKECKSYESGTMLEYPKKKKSKPPTPILVIAGVLEQEGKVLLRQRPSKGLLSGMWEFPAVEAPSREEGKALLQSLLEDHGFTLEVQEMICSIEHIFSHRIWDLEGYRIQCSRLPKKLPKGWVWQDWNSEKEALWAGPHRKVADYLRNE